MVGLNLNEEILKMTQNTIDIDARDVVHMNEDTVFALPNVPMNMHFDDGILLVSRTDTIYSWYLWHVHRVFQDTEILMEHHLAGTTVTPKTHMDLLAKIRVSAIRKYSIGDFVNVPGINKTIYEATNHLYNGMTVRLEEYITSISILDFMDIHFHPRVKEINDALKTKPYLSNDDINEGHSQILKVLSEDATLNNNPVARAAKHKLVNPGQIMQCISSRGFVTDVDNHRFPYPIRSGYVEGMKSFGEYAIESRTATTSEFMTATPMQQSEYLNRLLQMSTSVVKRVHPEECNSKESILMVVDTAGKLKDMQGIHYYEGEGEHRVEKVLHPDDRHLIGKAIKLRTVFTCTHPDRYGVCASCYGDLAYNLVLTDNAGHTAAVELQADQSQLLMSHKHHTNSAGSRDFTLSPEATAYLTRKPMQANNIYMRKFVNSSVSIVIYIDEGRNLDDLKHLTDLKSIAPERITHLTGLGFFIKKNGVETRELVSVKADTRTASLTMEALEYVHKTGWTINSEGSYVINMDAWDVDLPLLALPEEQFSTVEYSKTIRKFVKGTSGVKKAKATDAKTIVQYDNPSQALSAFHDMVALKLNVNFSHLAIILFATTSQDIENGDYNLPFSENRINGQFTRHHEKMKNGNMSAAMAYEEQTSTLFNPRSYLFTKRPTHEFDDILLGDIDEPRVTD